MEHCLNPSARNPALAPGSTALVAQIRSRLGGDTGPIAIQSGHFMLLPANGTCEPSVDTGAPAQHAATSQPGIQEALSRFSLETWRLGAVLLQAHLRLHPGTRVLTLVNDWQFLRNRSVTN